MASSEDFQSIYELYKKQGIPNGISIVKFCQHNGIVYSQFERWFKSRKKMQSPPFIPFNSLIRMNSYYGEMMRKSLSYMINGWEELQNYRKDGRYTIDNMLVERAIRSFTVHRKSSLFFSSEEGGKQHWHFSF